MADIAALRENLRERYAFERELGRGGMATVWLARDLRHDRPVALKVLHPELAATLGPERFQREIRLAARLQHPHILTVHDSGDLPRAGSTPLLWFTMPFVEGESCATGSGGSGSSRSRTRCGSRARRPHALSYAHRHEVIHRDIKPENILLTARRDTRWWPTSASPARWVGMTTELTETGLAIGTPAYMSPEQAVGDRGLDARTDVYSLGAVLYEMLAGEPPYTGATTQAILAKRFTEPAPSVQGCGRAYPKAWTRPSGRRWRRWQPIVSARWRSSARRSRRRNGGHGGPTDRALDSDGGRPCSRRRVRRSAVPSVRRHPRRSAS